MIGWCSIRNNKFLARRVLFVNDTDHTHTHTHTHIYIYIYIYIYIFHGQDIDNHQTQFSLYSLSWIISVRSFTIIDQSFFINVANYVTNTFNNELFSLVCSIPNDSVLIIGGDMDAQTKRKQRIHFTQLDRRKGIHH